MKYLPDTHEILTRMPEVVYDNHCYLEYEDGLWCPIKINPMSALHIHYVSLGIIAFPITNTTNKAI